MIGFHIHRRIITACRGLFMNIIPTKDDKGAPISEDDRFDKVVKVEGHITNGTFYLMSTIWGMYVIWGQDWLPTYMHGTGDLLNGIKNLPFLKIDDSVIIYGLWNLGYRVEGFLVHVFLQDWDNDFEEMVLHDVSTISLMFGYIMANFIPGGTIIIILHDIPDVTNHLCKAAHYSIFGFLAAPLFILTQFLWAYYRLYCLPMIIW